MTRFADVTRESGIDFQYTTSGFKGGGLAVADLDGDGLPEILAGQRTGGLRLFENRGSLRFQERTGAGIDPTTAASAIAVADLDNDGDRDLVVASPANVALVMANQGDGRFVVIARLDDAGTTEHVLPVDLDGDGLLDLHFSNYDLFNPSGTFNRLYLNRGGLQFASAGMVGNGLSWTATAFDVDADGDQDLYVANDTLLPDYGWPATTSTTWPADLLLRNDGLGPDGVPRFTDIASELGLATPRSSMGGLLGDFDGDGRLDLYIPNFGAKKLFLRDSAGGFIESATELGVTGISRHHEACSPTADAASCLVLSWSAALSDFDLDGYDELLLVNGETSPADPPPVLVFARGQDLPYRELAPSIACMDARAVVVTDLDADGDQDIVIAQKDGPLVIYENLGSPAPRMWLHVLLRGRASNREGVGAIVTVRLASGRVLTRIVGAGGVIHSASPAEAYFGVGNDDDVETVDVRWPSGRRTEVMRPPTGISLVLEESP